MDDNAVAFLYTLMAALSGSMGVRLTLDVLHERRIHKPMKPIVTWLAGLFSTQGVLFIALATARLYLVDRGVPAPWLTSPLFAVLLLVMAVCIIGFYTSFRTVRLPNERVGDLP